MPYILQRFAILSYCNLQILQASFADMIYLFGFPIVGIHFYFMCSFVNLTLLEILMCQGHYLDAYALQGRGVYKDRGSSAGGF